MSSTTNFQNKTAVIHVTVQPKSSRSKIVVSESDIKVYLNAPPVDGKANAECVQLLSKALGIAKSYIEIEKGDKSKKKTIRIKGLDEEEVINLLQKV